MIASKPIQYGLIADEVADVLPDLVTRSADGQIETVKHQVLDLLANKMQRPPTQITAQKRQILALKEQFHERRAAFSGFEVTLERGLGPGREFRPSFALTSARNL